MGRPAPDGASPTEAFAASFVPTPDQARPVQGTHGPTSGANALSRTSIARSSSAGALALSPNAPARDAKRTISRAIATSSTAFASASTPSQARRLHSQARRSHSRNVASKREGVSGERARIERGRENPDRIHEVIQSNRELICPVALAHAVDAFAQVHAGAHSVPTAPQLPASRGHPARTQLDFVSEQLDFQPSQRDFRPRNTIASKRTIFAHQCAKCSPRSHLITFRSSTAIE